MNDVTPANPLATTAAEDILRAIYGEDLLNCPTRPAAITPFIEEALAQQLNSFRRLMTIYQQVLEAVHRISTPPGSDLAIDPAELRSLLSERLDGIHELTTTLLTTTEGLKEAAEES